MHTARAGTTTTATATTATTAVNHHHHQTDTPVTHRRASRATWTDTSSVVQLNLTATATTATATAHKTSDRQTSVSAQQALPLRISHPPRPVNTINRLASEETTVVMIAVAEEADVAVDASAAEQRTLVI
jgi:hypothetical protein